MLIQIGYTNIFAKYFTADATSILNQNDWSNDIKSINDLLNFHQRFFNSNILINLQLANDKSSIDHYSNHNNSQAR